MNMTSEQYAAHIEDHLNAFEEVKADLVDRSLIVVDNENATTSYKVRVAVEQHAINFCDELITKYTDLLKQIKPDNVIPFPGDYKGPQSN